MLAQVFWTETFSNGCSANCDATTYTTGPNGVWTVTDVSSPGTKCNKWFVSCAEDGNSAGSCGSGCSASDPSLHVGSRPVFIICSSGDCGAAYNASGVNNITNKRATSPLIDCTGKTGITLSFNYIGKGQSCTTDYCDLQISTNGGTTWSILQACLTSSTCAGGQGLWKAFSIALPSSANNNSNVKIGFRWANNGDGAGSDPSFAVDDITLSTTLPLPIELISFSGKNHEKENVLYWITATETNNDFFTVERSSDAINFESIGTIHGAGNSLHSNYYSFFDEESLEETSYYRLKQTDYDGNYSFSNTISLYREHSDFEIVNAYHSVEQNVLEATINCSGDCLIQVELIDIQGKKVFSTESNSSGSVTKISIPTGNLQQGIYLLKAYNGNKLISRKIKL